MNYINNLTAMCCCGFNDRDKIEVSETYAMIDCETGDEVKFSSCSGFAPGHTYRCEKRWALTRSYVTLDAFTTREAAFAAYKKILDGLRESNTVIEV